MLMDEPFGALDPVTRDELGRAYRALHDRLGLTTIMVTHDMAEALLLADRIVVLIDGRIRADAPPAALLAGQCRPRSAGADRRAAPPGAERWLGSRHEPGPFARRWPSCPALLRAHLLVSGSAILIGVAVGLPLASGRRATGARARPCWVWPGWSRPSRRWRCWRSSIRCC